MKLQGNSNHMVGKTIPYYHSIAFGSRAGGVEQVFVMLASGGEPLQLTHDEGDKQVDSFAPDGKSFVDPILSRNKVTFYRQAWSGGRLLGKPRVALRLPIAFSSF